MVRGRLCGLHPVPHAQGGGGRDPRRPGGSHRADPEPVQKRGVRAGWAGVPPLLGEGPDPGRNPGRRVPRSAAPGRGRACHGILRRASVRGFSGRAPRCDRRNGAGGGPAASGLQGELRKEGPPRVLLLLCVQRAGHDAGGSDRSGEGGGRGLRLFQRPLRKVGPFHDQPGELSRRGRGGPARFRRGGVPRHRQRRAFAQQFHPHKRRICDPGPARTFADPGQDDPREGDRRGGTGPLPR